MAIFSRLILWSVGIGSVYASIRFRVWTLNSKDSVTSLNFLKDTVKREIEYKPSNPKVSIYIYIYIYIYNMHQYND